MTDRHTAEQRALLVRRLDAVGRRGYDFLVTPAEAEHLLALVAEVERVTRERDGQEKVLAACARLLGDDMPSWEPRPVREIGCSGCSDVAALREQNQQLRDLASKTLDECETWMEVAGMDGADPPDADDFARLTSLRAALGDGEPL